MPFRIVRDNIVHMSTDAIVNAANSGLRMGGGVCGSIFDVAGADDMQRACAAIGGCDVGRAVITPGFALPAKYVIHAVGPVWRGGDAGEEAQLRSCYQSSLALALERGLASVAFPLISSGIYGYPRDKALAVAVSAIGEFLLKHDMLVYLVVYDRASYQLSGMLFSSVESYIDEHYVDERTRYAHLRRNLDEDFAEALTCEMPSATPPLMGAVTDSLKKRVSHLDDTFSQAVLGYIDRSGEKDSDVYKRANLDRKLFSKLRGDRNYQPSKQTALSLAIALRLGMDDTRDLLKRAGYALSPSRRSDVIVSYFIDNGKYDIFELNEVLFAFDEPCL